MNSPPNVFQLVNCLANWERFDACVAALRGVDVEERDAEGYTALARAVERSDTLAVDRLLAAGANPQTAMSTALREDNGLALRLAARGAVPKIDDVLHSATAFADGRDRAESLLAAVRLHPLLLREEVGGTPFLLHLAAGEDANYTIPLVAGYTDDVDMRGRGGDTAAIVAARERSERALYALFKCGADLFLRNDAGESAAGHFDAMYDLFYVCLRLDDQYCIRRLIQDGLDINARPGGTQSLTGLIFEMQCVPLFPFLAAHNADFDTVMYDGKTALDHAMMRKDLHCVVQLLKCGASANFVYKKWTPLKRALDFIKIKPENDYNDEFNMCIVFALLNAGADPLARDADGRLFVEEFLGTDERKIVEFANNVLGRQATRGSATKAARQ